MSAAVMSTPSRYSPSAQRIRSGTMWIRFSSASCGDRSAQESVSSAIFRGAIQQHLLT